LNRAFEIEAQWARHHQGDLPLFTHMVPEMAARTYRSIPTSKRKPDETKILSKVLSFRSKLISHSVGLDVVYLSVLAFCVSSVSWSRLSYVRNEPMDPGPMRLPTIDEINAVSTVVIALATVALTVVALVQIKHRNDDKKTHQGRLEAVAKHHGLLVQRAMRDAVVALDALRLHDRHLASWGQQALIAHHFLVKARRELSAVMEALIERHAGTPAAIEEMLTGTLSALLAARELAGPSGPALTEQEVITRYATARKHALVCLNRLEVELQLPVLPLLLQPTEAPGALIKSLPQTGAAPQT